MADSRCSLSEHNLWFTGRTTTLVFSNGSHATDERKPLYGLVSGISLLAEPQRFRYPLPPPKLEHVARWSETDIGVIRIFRPLALHRFNLFRIDDEAAELKGAISVIAEKKAFPMPHRWHCTRQQTRIDRESRPPCYAAG